MRKPFLEYMTGTYRSFTDYTLTLCSIGGPSVITADGLIGTDKGILATADAASAKQIVRGTDSLQIGTPYRASVLMKAAADDFGRLQITHNGDVMHAWVNLLTGVIGTEAASAGLNETWTAIKRGFGWVELSVVFTPTGATFASMRIAPCGADNSTATDAWNRTIDDYPPHMFVDAVLVTLP